MTIGDRAGSTNAPFKRVALIGLGLIGSSLARAMRETMPEVEVRGYDADPDVRRRAAGLALTDFLPEDAGLAVEDSDLVIFCVPVRRMVEAALAVAGKIAPGTIVTDVGSCKEATGTALRSALPHALVIPGHPIAGTENSGPEAGFAELFRNRWCILTPEPDVDAAAVERLAGFWRALGARVELMQAARHDLVLAVTSHLPHLIAYTMVGTASHLEAVTEGEIIKYSAGGFRDFTRIAASNPTMWRDIFLSNGDSVLKVLGQLRSDLGLLEEAIRRGDGDTLFDWFTRTRAIRGAIVGEGQDVAAPDFGRMGN